MYSGLEKLVLKYVKLIQYYLKKTATNPYGIFSQSHGYKYFYLILNEKKTIKNETHNLKVKKNCISFQIYTCTIHRLIFCTCVITDIVVFA